MDHLPFVLILPRHDLINCGLKRTLDWQGLCQVSSADHHVGGVSTSRALLRHMIQTTNPGRRTANLQTLMNLDRRITGTAVLVMKTHKWQNNAVWHPAFIYSDIYHFVFCPSSILPEKWINWMLAFFSFSEWSFDFLILLCSLLTQNYRRGKKHGWVRESFATFLWQFFQSLFSLNSISLGNLPQPLVPTGFRALILSHER